MDLGVTSIPERVETATPRSNDARASRNDQTKETNAEGSAGKEPEESLELAAGDSGTDIVEEGEQLKEAKDACLVLVCRHNLKM
jgi:hypothetical protein